MECFPTLEMHFSHSRKGEKEIEWTKRMHSRGHSQYGRDRKRGEEEEKRDDNNCKEKRGHTKEVISLAGEEERKQIANLLPLTFDASCCSFWHMCNVDCFMSGKAEKKWDNRSTR